MTIDWKRVAGRMRADLDRAALNERPRLVLSVLVKATLMKCRTCVVLPDREALCALLGIGKQHMAGVWREIEAARIAAFKKVELGWECVIFPNASQWACEWVCTTQQLEQWLEFVDRVPGQAQGSLLAPDPSLNRALADVSAESSQNGNCKTPLVPKMGTGFAPKSVSTQENRTPLRSLKVQSEKPCTKLSTLNIKGSDENELMDRCRALFGEQNMATYGGNWRNRARQDAEKLDRVLAETKAAIAEGRVRTIPGAFANDLWNRW